MLDLKMPDAVPAPVLGMMVRRLLNYERDVWLLVVWWLGFRLGDPILDWLEHIEALEAAIAKMPKHWGGGRRLKWARRVRKWIPKELGAFVMRMTLPRTDDLLMHCSVRPMGVPATFRRRCCCQCAADQAFLLKPLENRIGRKAAQRIYAETANTSTCSARIEGQCEWYDHVSQQVGRPWTEPIAFSQSISCEHCTGYPSGIRKSNHQSPDLPSRVEEYSMCWEPTRIYTPRDVHKVRVRGSHGVRMCPSDRLWIYEGAIVESWWEYTPKKPFD